MEPFEPPKYIASLIAAINDGAKSAQIGALAFTAIGLFLLATAFSATDEDLLLNHAIGISQLGGAQVPVVFAFGLAPAVFLAAHLYTLIRYDMLASSLRQLLGDLPKMVRVEADRERCRQLLANVEFVNDLVMPPKSRSSSWLFRWTVAFLIAVFPVAVLLLVQISSLRLQHAVVNWVHHGCLAIDVVLLVWFFGRRGGDGNWSFWTAPLRRKAALCVLPLLVMAMDLAWLTVPDADATTVRTDILDYADYAQWLHDKKEPELDRRTRVLLALPVQPIDMLLCRYVGWGCRFLTVTYRPLVAKVWDTTGFVDLRGGAEADRKHLAAFERASLRGRVLRFVVLTGSELFAADLTDAQLQHAELTDVVLKGAELQGAQLQGAYLGSAQLQGANLLRAQLQGANLILAQLRGAYLGGAQLQGAELAGAQLQVASLLGAQLQGAGLAGTQLQGAFLGTAQLQGANLNGAQLQGANLLGAQLQGADLAGAQLQGADLGDAALWGVFVNAGTQMGLSDLRGVTFVAPDETARAEALAGAPDHARQGIEEALTSRVGAQTLPTIGTAAGPVLVDDAQARPWRALSPGQIVTNPAETDEALAALLADTVAPLMPEVAERIASRALSALGEKPVRPLGKLLGCRLQNQAQAGHVTLQTSTIDNLKAATGPCDQPVQ